MIDLLAIDRWSATGRSWLHRAPAAAKASAVVAVVALLVVLRQPVPLVALYGGLLACLLTTGLPVWPVLGLSLLPVAMSGVFAISRLGGGPAAAAVVILKGAIASLTMLLLVATTPHTTLLGLVRRALPGPLADMLFLGYRSIYVVLGRALAARDALRLRGGAGPWYVRLRRGTLVAALSVLRAVELASDQYAALQLRTTPQHFAGRRTTTSAPPAAPASPAEPRAAPVDPAQSAAVLVRGPLVVRYPDGRTVTIGGAPIDIRPGARVAFLGANGSGKSTLLRAVLGLVRPVAGEVRVLGHDPAREFDAVRPQVGAVLQDVEAQLLAPTVREDLAFGLSGRGLSRDEIGDRVAAAARAFRLEPLLDRVPHYLSGGERRKVALAGALVTEPQLLVLDEPFAGLDPRSRDELVDLIQRAHAERNLTLLLATHEVEQLPGLVDLVCVLGQDGAIRALGPVHEVLAAETLLRECNVEPPVLTRLRMALARRGVSLPLPGVGAGDDLDQVETLAALLAMRLARGEASGLLADTGPTLLPEATLQARDGKAA